MGLQRYIGIFLAVLLAVVLAVPAAGAVDDRLAVERQVYRFLTTELRLSNAAACGVLANIEHESNFQPTIYGDHGTSYGLCQWHNSRFAALRGYCSALGLDHRTVEGQMAYLKYELGNNYTSLLLTLQSIGDTPDGAYQAGYLWCVRFEMPKDMELKGHNRGTLAQGKYWNRYKNGEPVSMLPETEPETPELPVEEVIEELRQPSVTIPVPQAESTVRQDVTFPDPEFRYYTPWHLPKQTLSVQVQPEPEPTKILSWEWPALAAIALTAAAVWFWPQKTKTPILP